MKKALIPLALIVCTLLFAGCGDKTITTNAPSASSQSTAPASSSEAASSSASQSASSSEAPKAKDLDAEGVVEHLLSSGLPIENIIVYTSESDPNELLGRPGQYTSKVNFADNRVEQWDEEDPTGGSVEVFENAKDAQARYTYVEEVNSVMSALNQYLYLSDNILLRVDHELTPEQAEEYRQSFEALINA